MACYLSSLPAYFFVFCCSATTNGSYTLTLQAIGPCDAFTVTTTFNAVCNAPAAFVCLNNVACPRYPRHLTWTLIGSIF